MGDIGSEHSSSWCSSQVITSVPTPNASAVHADLPDLTWRLKQQGIYEDYLIWQHSYREWRKGSAQGARGEVTHFSQVTPVVDHKAPTFRKETP